VVVVTQEATSGSREALPYFLIASLVTLVIGALVAVVLGRRLSRPVTAAADASRRIAAGELSTRLPAPADREHDELADLTRSINTMAAGLERSRVLEQQFLLSVSHDLRTPLTSIRGYATAICDGTAPDNRAAAEVILDGSRRLERLVADLLDLAHLDGRSLALELVDHDVRGDADVAVRAVAATAAGAGVTVRLTPGDPVVVRADPSRVRQLLANLLDNARKYARSSIDVRVRTVDGMAVVEVDDDGPGIAPEDRPHVFERLYVTALRPARAEVGSGLGLAIVRQLAEAMGGSVAVGVAPTGGARLEVRLPLASASTGRERAGGERESRSPPASTGS
jgi:two-component system sensor histidine kinase BaeS